jgi:uncharacterized protein
MRGLARGVAAVLLVLAAPAAADVKTGVDAWQRGDFKAAVEQWRGPAVAGDADAQFNLGQAYKLGRGVPEDPALAQSWFRKAALQGHQQAEDNYGLSLFQTGRKTEAVPWLEKSVARGEPRSQLVLGTMLFNGDGVTRDWVRAYALMTRASAANLRSASETLAQMDQYIPPEDRAKGTALAKQYETQTKLAALAPAGPPRATVRATDLPASQATPDAAPERPAPVRFTPPRAPRPAPSRAALAPTPRPEPAPAPVRASGGGYRVQLGAFRDAGNARALWAKLGARVGGSASYVPGGGVTRLQAGPFASAAAAGRACAAARAGGSACVVVAP